MFLTNGTLLNVNKVTLTDELISNICWKVELSKQGIKKEDFLKLVYWKKNLVDQFNNHNCKNIFQDVFMFK